MVNERKTEQIVREHFKQYENEIKIEEQRSDNPRIQRLLKNASKQGDGRGQPEFIVTFDENPNLVVVVECKASRKKHVSENKEKPKDYAVDGALLYSSYLAKEFNVISIGVSGEKEKNLQVSTYIQVEGASKAKNVDSKELLSPESYLDIYRKDPDLEDKLEEELMEFSQELHNYLRDSAKLSEKEKPLLISAILIALEDQSFRNAYKDVISAKRLSELLLDTVKSYLRDADVPHEKIERMINPYDFIEVHRILSKKDDEEFVLKNIISQIDGEVKPIMDQYYHDILGQFYQEFLRYTGGDKKGLGIVLTPKHITELFAEVADVHKDDVVLDNCCGTAGFLISSMKNMLEGVNSKEEQNKIKSENLIGIEPQSHMFALACANMILRGDGKANIYQNSCFDIADKIKENHSPTVALLNPPYNQNDEDESELQFVLNALNSLEKNGICVAIVPISVLTDDDNPDKKRILENHTLEAAMSMPEDLFHPAVSAVTGMMVLRAHKPHPEDKETWFGYWKDDGFEKRRGYGRVDPDNQWPSIKREWLNNYRNKREQPGQSVLQKVSHDDEWCPEPYMETDYQNLTEEDFEKEMKKYAIFQMKYNDKLQN